MKSCLCPMAVLSLFVYVPLAAHSLQPPDTRITGTVVDASGGVLPGVTVTLGAERELVTATTDSDGRFTLPPVPAGAHVVRATLAGFQALERQITVDGTTPVDLSLSLAVMGFSDQVLVTAAREEREVARVPAAVGLVDEATIQDGRMINLAEALARVPGVQAGDVSGVDDVRLTIRGAGVRATFGSRGVILMVDGVPVTEPDGQTPHIDGQVDLASAERIEVVKGPSSAVYGGAALGGVVNVITRAPSRAPQGSFQIEGGSYEFGKVHGAASGAIGPVAAFGSAGVTHLDGFRDHNDLRNWTVGGRGVWDASTRDRLAFSAFATDAELALPGTLNREQFETDASQTRPEFITNDWGREDRIVRAGARYERSFGNGHLLEVDSYGQVRELFHPIFVVIDQDAARYMGHARYRSATTTHTITTGVDLDTQAVDDRWFVNSGGQPGFQIRDDDDRVTNLGLYFQDELGLHDRWTMTAGVRYDRITFDLHDRLLFDGDASDRLVFERVSPKIGVAGRWSDAVTLYGSVATGFEVPTLGEVRLPAGFNETVDPQRAVSVEGGVRGQAGRLSYDASLYHMRISDEILPVTIDNVTQYRNVARSGHTGL